LGTTPLWLSRCWLIVLFCLFFFISALFFSGCRTIILCIWTFCFFSTHLMLKRWYFVYISHPNLLKENAFAKKNICCFLQQILQLFLNKPFGSWTLNFLLVRTTASFVIFFLLQILLSQLCKFFLYLCKFGWVGYDISMSYDFPYEREHI